MARDARLDATVAQSLIAVTTALARGGPAVLILRQIAREVQRLTGADSVAIYQLDPQPRLLRPIAGYHIPKTIPEAPRRTPLPLTRWPVIAAALRDHEPVRSDSADWRGGADPEFLRLLPRHAALVIPMVVGGDPVGVLYAAWWSANAAIPRLPSEALTTVATSAGAALQALLVGRDTMRKLQHSETLLAVSRALSSTVDLYSVMRHLLRWTARTLSADTVGAYTLQDDEWLVPVQGYRLPPPDVDALRRAKLSVKANAFYAAGVAGRRAVFSPNVSEEAGIPEAIRTATPHRAQLFVPIVARDRLVGGLVALWVSRTPELQPDEFALIESIAAQAGVVIENARLFEANARQVEELSSLDDLARTVTGELERGTILDALHEPVRRGLGADAVALYWRGAPEAELELILRIGDDVAIAELPARVVREAQPIRHSTASRHWLGVPARAGDDILGVLAVARSGAPFTASQESFASHAAQLVALALRSATLYDERVRIHEELVLAQEHVVRSERLRALGEMASGIAHDFNNLLAAILGRVQLLQRHIKDARFLGWLRVIEQSALDGSDTVRRLQEFTRVRKDRPLAPVDLTQIVEDAITLTEPQWRDASARHGVQIQVVKRLTAVPAVLGAASELREVMTNLILNSLDAMPRGGRLTVATTLARNHVVVTITDTGVGMTDEVKRHLFDPFFTTKGTRGTGLGLSVTYGIVSRHGGEIGVESVPGEGTTFTLSFPVAVDTAHAEPTPPREARPSAPLRCLVVDDERDIMEAVRDILEAYGHDVVTSDPPAALAQVRDGRFDVVITDLAMQGVTGWQVSEAAKDREPELPVILMSGFGIEIDAEERRRRRIDAVLAKPIAIDDLLATLAAVTASRTPSS